MNKKRDLLNKTLVIGISIIFFGAGIIPTISGHNNNNQDTISLTFYTFDMTGTKKCKVELPSVDAEEISNIFEELKNKIINNPYSDETQSLKNDFVEILDNNGLISKKISKDYVQSLLNPKWLQNIIENNLFAKQYSIGSRIKNDIVPRPLEESGSAFLCSIVGEGYGLLFSPIMLPRPRLATIWSSYIGAKFGAANLITGHGFIAEGPQLGVALGFIGIGLSFAFPGEAASFGFGGYALSTFVRAENIETYP